MKREFEPDGSCQVCGAYPCDHAACPNCDDCKRCFEESDLMTKIVDEESGEKQ